MMPTDETQRTPTPCPNHEAREEVKDDGAATPEKAILFGVVLK